MDSRRAWRVSYMEQATLNDLAPAGQGSPTQGLPLLRQDPFAGARERERDQSRRGPRLRKLLLRTDIATGCLAILAVELLRRSVWGHSTPGDMLALFAAVTIPVWVVCAHGFGLYHVATHRVEHGMAEELGPILRVTTMWAWGIVLVGAATRIEVEWVQQLAMLWAAVVLFALLGRALARAYARRQQWYRQRALVIDMTPQTASVVRKILRHPQSKIDVVAAVDIDGALPEVLEGERFWSIPIVQGAENVPGLIDAFDIDRVIVGWGHQGGEREALLHQLASIGVHVDLIPTWFDAVGARMDVHELEGSPMMTLPRGRLAKSSQLLKRALDICVSAAGLLVLTPLFLACAIAIKLDTRGPVFFRQVRIGRDGNGFDLFKFRSMHLDAEDRKAELADLSMGALDDAGLFKIPDDPRITRVGRLMRRYSLDELPQLVNVLRGQMSLVGPRPLIENEARQVSGHFRHRLSLTPGLTGLWQVHGRSDIPFDEMVSLDYLYVTNWSLWGDVKLLIKTLPAVTAGRGAY